MSVAVTMFDQTFVNGRRDSKKPAAIVLSLLLQIGVMCIVILIPLIYSEALPSAQLKSVLIAPSPPPPLTPVPPRKWTPKVESLTAVRQFESRRLLAPSVVPKRVLDIGNVSPAPEIGVFSSPGSENGAAFGLIGAVTGPPADAPPSPSMVKHSAPKPMRVGGQIAQANLIERIQPVYPQLAKSARVQGRVEFTATISKEGRIENLQLVRGHPLLVNAAKEAVLQWRYRPTLLNGEPVEVVTDIVVDFALNP